MEPDIISQWMEVGIWVIVLVALVYCVVRFLQMPNEDKKRMIMKLLLDWVVKAEQALGSGTGKVKLSEVYGKFCSSFPILKWIVSFETFSEWVDEALDEMREMLETNDNLRDVVEGF